MMRKIKIKCKYCGKEFIRQSTAQKYCSVECRKAAKKETKTEKEIKTGGRYLQPCWYCKNYINGCSWSRSFIPVEGWTAKPVKRVYGFANGETKVINTYKIIKCPEFVSDYA